MHYMSLWHRRGDVCPYRHPSISHLPLAHSGHGFRPASLNHSQSCLYKQISCATTNHTCKRNVGAVYQIFHREDQHGNIPKVSCYALNSFNCIRSSILNPLELKKLIIMLDYLQIILTCSQP